MTVQEMHIELDMELQKINSFATTTLIPQEKDWLLNNEVLKYIKSKYRPKPQTGSMGIEVLTKDLTDLKSWIKTKKNIEGNIVDGQCSFPLPDDFLFPVSSLSHVVKDCDKDIDIVEKEKHLYFLDLTTTEAIEAFEVNYVNVITRNLFSLSNLPDGYLTSYNREKQTFLLINALKQQLKEHLNRYGLSTSLYWEKYDNIFKPNTFIIVSDTPITTLTYTLNNTTKNLSHSVLKYDTIDKDTKLRSKNRIVEHEFLYDMVTSYLSKSTDRSPISTYDNQNLNVILPSSVIINKVDLIYICKPTLIDVLLNRNLNADTYIKKEIISNTARHCKAIFNDPDYQLYIRENILTE